MNECYCETCKFSQHTNEDEMICTNVESEYYMDWVENNNFCDEYEESK